MIEQIWDKQSQWSQAAGALKGRVSWAQGAILVLSIVAAFLSTLGAVTGVEETLGKALVYVAAAMTAGVAIANAFTGKEGLEPWTNARAVSEAIKSEVYTYLPGAGDYAGDDADDRLARKVEAFEAGAAEVFPKADAITPESRTPPDFETAAEYAEVRVKTQRDDYYLKNARTLSTRILFARVAEVALGATGAALAAVAAGTENGDLAVWVPVITTATAAIAAHVAAKRWRFLWVEYSRTAMQLSHLLSAFEQKRLKDGEFVVKCETVISMQNKAWFAKLSAPDAK